MTRLPLVVAALAGDQSYDAKPPEVIAVELETTDISVPEVSDEEARYSPVPLVRALALKAKAEEVVVPVATLDVNDCAPVPEVKLRAVVPVLLPIEIIRAVASVPSEILPVVVLPNVSVCIAVVERLPVALK